MGSIKIGRMMLGMCQTNCYFVYREGTNKVIFVDSADYGEQIYQRMKDNGFEIAAILVTHGHFDHATGAREFADEFGIKIYAYEAEKETLENPKLNVSWMNGQSLVFSADEFLKDEQEIDLAGFHIRVLFTPGHTPGGCCFYFPYQDVVFTGDSLFCMSVGRTDFEKGSMSDLVRSVKEKLMTLTDRTTVYPGHNDVTSIENERMYNPYL